MKKILIVSTVSRQFYLFEQVNIEVLKSLGYEIHAAANYSDANERLDSLDIIRHHFDIERSPFSLKNIKAYKQLKKIMKSEKFNAVHCHSPMGGVLARLAAKAVGIPSVIYTAHGFHFFKGAPIINWLLYYPVERFLSRYTDILLTINKEDNNIAQSFKTKKNVFIPGVGVNTDKITNIKVNKEQIRNKLGVPKDSIVLLSVGELNKNKNHEIIIKSLAKLKKQDIYYFICGMGDRKQYLEDLATSLGVTDKVIFLGFRNDVEKIYKSADIFVFPSYREGLSVSLIEAMAAGLPIVCSQIRGNSDLVEHGVNGFLCDPSSVDDFVKNINELIKNKELREMYGKNNIEKSNQYNQEAVKKIMRKVYSNI